MKNTKLFVVVAAACLTFTQTALAHVGGGAISPAEGGLIAGLLHPLLGLDHLLAMIAVGVWAAQLGGRAVWMVPSAFVMTMILGAALGIEHVALPLVEVGIIASVVALGLAIAIAFRAHVAIAAVCVGVFALFHGHAHGTELAAGASGLAYGIGFTATTAALHATGILLAYGVREHLTASALRYAGGAIACVGVLLGLGL